MTRLRRHFVQKQKPLANLIPRNDDCHLFRYSEQSEESVYVIKNEFGFTLAEVLITLGIIGIIAALTMPSLIAKQREKQTVTALKKFYSSISQAHQMSKFENGLSSTWYNGELIGSAEANKIMEEKLIPFLKITKNCGTDKGCFPDVVYKRIDGMDLRNYNTTDFIRKYVTSDGMSLYIFSYGIDTKDYGEGILQKSTGAITVDINGLKGPNIMGDDMFTFQMTDEGIIPVGAAIYNPDVFPAECRRKNCLSSCESCTAWVIYNENLDYLHCDDLSWDGKTKCK